MPSKSQRLLDAPTCATLGVCIYLVGFSFPVPGQLPLLGLVGFSVLAALRSQPRSGAFPRLLAWSVAGFLIVSAASIGVSVDRGRSLALSTAWIPGLLLFVVISERIQSVDRIRVLYACLSFVAVALSSTLLVATLVYGPNPHEWIGDLNLPALVVPNDCNFLALLSPLALVILIEKPGSALGVLGATAIVLVMTVIGTFGSRGGALTLAVSLVAAAAIYRPKLGLAVIGFLFFGFLVVDGVQGYALASKFTRVLDSRISLWLVAWEMFLDAPWLGHGPHTYKTLYPTYLETMNFPSWVTLDPWGVAVPWVHNLYLEMLAERGAFGLAAFTGMLGSGLFLALRLQKTASREVQLLGAGATGSLLGFAISGVYETSLIRIWAVILLASLLGVIASLSNRSAAEEQVAPSPAKRKPRKRR